MKKKKNMCKTNKVIETYNAAADSFDKEPLGFWDFYGQLSVNQTCLKPGDRVLDVCCGSGASAIPAAQRVGKMGLVVGVDMADKLLQLGQSKAEVEGLDWLLFIEGNMEQIRFHHSRFDAVVCVFGIFFFPDMVGQLKRFWESIKQSGKLTITTWGKDIFYPVSQIWDEELSKIREDLVSSFNPWDDITTEEGLIGLYREIGIKHVQVTSYKKQQDLKIPEDFWTMAMGSGFRWTIEQLTLEEREIFKNSLLSKIKEKGIASVKTDALIATASKLQVSLNP